jgi:TetR/AcrR family transcriptional repressor of mexJK operon
MVRKSSTDRAVQHIAVDKHRRRAPARRARRGGRPSRAEALDLRARILETATGLFLTEGYGATSIEAVAGRAGISKRTFYHRFDNKAALFTAVVHLIIEQIRPPAGVPLLQGVTLHDILRRLAGFILRAALSPQAVALHRLITAESARFPHLVRAVYEEGWSQEATALIGELLAREMQDMRLTSKLRVFATMQFLQMLVGVPQRRSMGFGVPMTPAELDAWADDTVNLFLNGYRALSGEK